MAEQSPDWKSLCLEEQRRREEADQGQERAEEKTRKTALPEYLKGCHDHLYSGLTVQTDATLSTQGDPVNANSKLRPERLLIWGDFPTRQETLWDDLVSSDSDTSPQCTPWKSMGRLSNKGC